ncbi:MAG: Crp/Fnr family transcriptional regulator, partial [Clostridiales bacterium]|nr:Crp/Fnr family transcriptional regulator [Clostridiales bacterium]
MQLADKLKNTRIFQDLSAEQFETAFCALRTREVDYGRGETLVSAGAELFEFYCLLSGRVQGVRYHANGDTDLVQLFLPGELIGLDIASSATKRCPFWLVALEPCHGVYVDFATLFSPELPEDTAAMLARNVIRALANDSIRRLHKIDVLYRKGLRARIAVFLRHMAIMNGSREFT